MLVEATSPEGVSPVHQVERLAMKAEAPHELGMLAWLNNEIKDGALCFDGWILERFSEHCQYLERIEAGDG